MSFSIPPPVRNPPPCPRPLGLVWMGQPNLFLYFCGWLTHSSMKVLFWPENLSVSLTLILNMLADHKYFLSVHSKLTSPNGSSLNHWVIWLYSLILQRVSMPVISKCLGYPSVSPIHCLCLSSKLQILTDLSSWAASPTESKAKWLSDANVLIPDD